MLQRVGERTYLIKGSPNTLLHEAPETLFVIDPGSEPDGRKLIAKETARSFNGKKIEVLLSHSHPEHVAALATLGPGLELYISEQEISSLVDVGTRRALTYMWADGSGDNLQAVKDSERQSHRVLADLKRGNGQVPPGLLG